MGFAIDGGYLPHQKNENPNLHGYWSFRLGCRNTDTLCAYVFYQQLPRLLHSAASLAIAPSTFPKVKNQTLLSSTRELEDQNTCIDALKPL
jgi:hypothetical protein